VLLSSKDRKISILVEAKKLMKGGSRAMAIARRKQMKRQKSMRKNLLNAEEQQHNLNSADNNMNNNNAGENPALDAEYLRRKKKKREEFTRRMENFNRRTSQLPLPRLPSPGKALGNMRRGSTAYIPMRRGSTASTGRRGSTASTGRRGSRFPPFPARSSQTTNFRSSSNFIPPGSGKETGLESPQTPGVTPQSQQITQSHQRRGSISQALGSASKMFMSGSSHSRDMTVTGEESQTTAGPTPVTRSKSQPLQTPRRRDSVTGPGTSGGRRDSMAQGRNTRRSTVSAGAQEKPGNAGPRVGTKKAQKKLDNKKEEKYLEKQSKDQKWRDNLANALEVSVEPIQYGRKFLEEVLESILQEQMESEQRNSERNPDRVKVSAEGVTFDGNFANSIVNNSNENNNSKDENTPRDGREGVRQIPTVSAHVVSAAQVSFSERSKTNGHASEIASSSGKKKDQTALEETRPHEIVTRDEEARPAELAKPPETTESTPEEKTDFVNEVSQLILDSWRKKNIESENTDKITLKMETLLKTACVKVYETWVSDLRRYYAGQNSTQRGERATVFYNSAAMNIPAAVNIPSVARYSPQPAKIEPESIPQVERDSAALEDWRPSESASEPSASEPSVSTTSEHGEPQRASASTIRERPSASTIRERPSAAASTPQGERHPSSSQYQGERPSVIRSSTVPQGERPSIQYYKSNTTLYYHHTESINKERIRKDRKAAQDTILNLLGMREKTEEYRKLTVQGIKAITNPPATMLPTKESDSADVENSNLQSDAATTSGIGRLNSKFNSFKNSAVNKLKLNKESKSYGSLPWSPAIRSVVKGKPADFAKKKSWKFTSFKATPGGSLFKNSLSLPCSEQSRLFGGDELSKFSVRRVFDAIPNRQRFAGAVSVPEEQSSLPQEQSSFTSFSLLDSQADEICLEETQTPGKQPEDAKNPNDEKNSVTQELSLFSRVRSYHEEHHGESDGDRFSWSNCDSGRHSPNDAEEIEISKGVEISKETMLDNFKDISKKAIIIDEPKERRDEDLHSEASSQSFKSDSHSVSTENSSASTAEKSDKSLTATENTTTTTTETTNTDNTSNASSNASSTNASANSSANASREISDPKSAEVFGRKSAEVFGSQKISQETTALQKMSQRCRPQTPVKFDSHEEGEPVKPELKVLVCEPEPSTPRVSPSLPRASPSISPSQESTPPSQESAPPSPLSSSPSPSLHLKTFLESLIESAKQTEAKVDKSLEELRHLMKKPDWEGPTVKCISFAALPCQSWNVLLGDISGELSNRSLSRRSTKSSSSRSTKSSSSVKNAKKKKVKFDDCESSGIGTSNDHVGGKSTHDLSPHIKTTGLANLGGDKLAHIGADRLAHIGSDIAHLRHHIGSDIAHHMKTHDIANRISSELTHLGTDSLKTIKKKIKEDKKKFKKTVSKHWKSPKCAKTFGDMLRNLGEALEQFQWAQWHEQVCGIPVVVRYQPMDQMPGYMARKNTDRNSMMSGRSSIVSGASRLDIGTNNRYSITDILMSSARSTHAGFGSTLSDPFGAIVGPVSFKDSIIVAHDNIYRVLKAFVTHHLGNKTSPPGHRAKERSREREEKGGSDIRKGIGKGVLKWKEIQRRRKIRIRGERRARRVLRKRFSFSTTVSSALPLTLLSPQWSKSSSRTDSAGNGTEKKGLTADTTETYQRAETQREVESSQQQQQQQQHQSKPSESRFSFRDSMQFSSMKDLDKRKRKGRLQVQEEEYILKRLGRMDKEIKGSATGTGNGSSSQLAHIYRKLLIVRQGLDEYINNVENGFYPENSERWKKKESEEKKKAFNEEMKMIGKNDDGKKDQNDCDKEKNGVHWERECDREKQEKDSAATKLQDNAKDNDKTGTIGKEEPPYVGFEEEETSPTNNNSRENTPRKEENKSPRKAVRWFNLGEEVKAGRQDANFNNAINVIGRKDEKVENSRSVNDKSIENTIEHSSSMGGNITSDGGINPSNGSSSISSAMGLFAKGFFNKFSPGRKSFRVEISHVSSGRKSNNNASRKNLRTGASGLSSAHDESAKLEMALSHVPAASHAHVPNTAVIKSNHHEKSFKPILKKEKTQNG